MNLCIRHYAVWLLLVGFLVIGCSRNPGDQRSGASMSSPPAATLLTPSSIKGSTIREIDFANFEYPLGKDVRITLRNGKHEGNPQSEDYPMALAYLAYGDATHDGSEEAIVVLSESVRGSAIPYYVFIYSIVQGAPQLLWSFETGDRADGGLRQVYAENGDLVIEIYGKGTSIGGELYNTEAAACCPQFFSRTRYQWSDGRFTKKGDVVVSANPAAGAAVIMPAYKTGK
jgi:hypothetical protein